LQEMGREWRTGRERMWEMKILVQKKKGVSREFIWRVKENRAIWRVEGSGWQLRAGVLNGSEARESNCRSIIIELLNGRAYCVGGWDYVTGSDSCCDEWWRCKKMGTRQTDLLSYVI
jgi:hypothetical protein